MNSLSAMTGLPATNKKKGPRRAKKPGGDHLAKLTQAHGAGDHHGARTHALNYAKEVTKHMKGSSPVDDAPLKISNDDVIEMMSGRSMQAQTNMQDTALPRPGVSKLAARMRSRSK